MVKNLFGWPLFYNHSFVHEDDMISDLACKTHLMRHNHHRHTLFCKLAHDLQQAGAKTLMWSLDGVLRYLPVAALHDGKQYLVESYQNVIFTPASLSRLKDPVSVQWKGLGLGVSKAHPGFAALQGVPEELTGIIRDENSQAKTGAY